MSKNNNRYDWRTQQYIISLAIISIISFFSGWSLKRVYIASTGGDRISPATSEVVNGISSIPATSIDIQNSRIREERTMKPTSLGVEISKNNKEMQEVLNKYEKIMVRVESMLRSCLGA